MNIHYSTQFKKDYKRIKKQNRDFSKLRTSKRDSVEIKKKGGIASFLDRHPPIINIGP